ncbi:exo-beta-N-acetylmuramidase NamZ family protein [Aegicerativicinus sediminis]|uniref:exo-beta-N-acetylmuramidase NamZ family protein n=1 Tax=Aegicerativicinus sediminis TaxID=2893202 RepID=UPI00293BF491|nr:DUF1343 domain-containing protein [Aegicerativicinus sediminis]
MVKNTVLFGLLIALSCIGSPEKSKNLDSSNEPKQTPTEVENSQEVVLKLGAERLDAYLPLLKNKGVGLVANPTSTIRTSLNSENSKYTHLVDTLKSRNVNLKSVFAPEHGFRGIADAGEHVKDGVDAKTGIPIISLYGENRKPTGDTLKGIDIMVFDLQDVGVRFYTYISTLHYIMEACAENNIPLIVLDRPNPNGMYIDGPTLEAVNKSFLGMHEIPLVHGMTIGEYAQMINGENWLKDSVKCKLSVITMKNYSHKLPYSLPVRPSPNLPNDQSIKLYPSLGLFEGTNINAGRGTEEQFQKYGAPYLDKNYFDYRYTPEPNFGSKHPKHEGQVCYGRDLTNLDFKPHFTLEFIIEAYNHCLEKDKFFLTSGFTKHAGTDKLQKQIVAGMSEKEIRDTWKADLEKFKTTRAKYLLYD